MQAVDKWLAARPLTVPTLLEVGQWDQEDSYGAPAVYRGAEGQESRQRHAAPRTSVRGGTRAPTTMATISARMTFTGDTAREWRVQYVKPFFDHYLKGGPDPTDAAGAHLCDRHQQVAGQPDAGRWATPTPIYLAADGIGDVRTPHGGGHDEYVSDPAKPVPFIPRPIDMNDATQWKPWLVHDQRFVSDRPDVASWKTAPLTKAVHIMGAPEVELFASTTGTDSDWVVKLIDVYPNEVPEGASQGSKPSMAGFELPIGIEIFRGRYSRASPQPRAAQGRQGGALSLGAAQRRITCSCRVTGSWCRSSRACSRSTTAIRRPIVDNIMYAKPGDYRKATQSIYAAARRPARSICPSFPSRARPLRSCA